MGFQDDFKTLNQDFLTGLDSRTAIWNGTKRVNVLLEAKFHETDLLGAVLENYDMEMTADIAEVEGIKHGDTFVFSDTPALTYTVIKIDYEDDFGMVRVALTKV